jgi:hypothetical protein
MLGRMSGKLGLNELGCFTVGNAVLIADFEASITVELNGVNFPRLGIRKLGQRVSGVGGFVETGGDKGEICIPPESRRAKENFVALSTVLGLAPS